MTSHIRGTLENVYGNLCRGHCRSAVPRRDFDIQKSMEPYPSQTSQLKVETQKFEFLLHVLQEEWTPNHGLLVPGTEEQREEDGPKCKLFRIRAIEVRNKPRCQITRRGTLVRWVYYRRDPVQCGRRTHVVAGFQSHI